MPTAAAGHRVVSGRVFIALWPPVEIATRIVRATAALVEQHRGRAVSAPDLHLTLVFLGELTSAQREAAAGALRRPLHAAFDLALDRLGCFRRAQVLWLAPRDPPPALLELQAALCERLAAAGFAAERRAFKAHLTLARRSAPMRARPLEAGIVWRADTLVLATSSPDNVPPRYRRLAVRSLPPP